MNVVFVLDRSGSMSTMADELVASFNEYLKGLDPKDKVTLVQFDDQYQVDHKKEKAKNVKPLVLSETYKPRGMTALNDAIGKAVNAVGDKKKCMFVILTDGQENASKEFSTAQVNSLLEDRRKRGWRVEWLAEQGVVQGLQASYGNNASNLQQYDSHVAGSRQAVLRCAAKSTDDYRTTGDQGQ